jgi:uncharacterized protein GlcG (DUF336 family)
MDLTGRRSIDRELARAAIDAAIRKSLRLGCRSCIAVVDPGGHLISFDRMDGAPFQSADLARDKAFSVAGNGSATDDLWELIKDDPWLVSGVQKVKGLVWLGGGAAVVIDGELVGAVGVSGDGTMQRDRQIADEAIAAILANHNAEQTNSHTAAPPCERNAR